MNQSRSAGISLRAVLAILIAVGALASASASARAAVSITSFSVTPDSTQAGGDPNLAINAQLSTSDGDTPSAMTFSLAPGLLADPTAPTICSAADFTAQECPTSSEIGDGTITGYAPAFGTTLPLQTELYLIQPTGSAIAQIGVVADFFDEPAADVSAPVSIRTTPSVGINLPMTNIPDEYDGVPIQIQSLALTLFGTVNGQPFTRNPTSCVPAVTGLSLVSYDAPAAPVSATSSFTPTGCSSLSYAPALSTSVALDSSDSGVAFGATVTQPATDAATQSLTMTLPSGIGPRLSELSDACSSTDLSTCASVGSATITTPLLAEPVVGQLVLAAVSGSILPDIDAVFPAPLGLSIQGVPSLAGGGLEAAFAGLPDVPLTSLQVQFSGGASSLFTANSTLCNTTQTVLGALLAQDGSTASVSSPVALTGCPAGSVGASGSGTGGTVGTGGTGSGITGTGGSGTGGSGSGTTGTGIAGTGSSGAAPGTSATVTSPGGSHAKPPTGSAHATGLTGKHPSLKVVIAAGTGAPALKRITVSLPKGFSLSRKLFPHGITVKLGQHLLGKNGVSMAGGVSAVLGSGGRTATVTLSSPTLRLPAGLALSLARHKAVRLVFLVTVHDTGNKQTKLRLTVKVV